MTAQLPRVRDALDYADKHQATIETLQAAADAHQASLDRSAATRVDLVYRIRRAHNTGMTVTDIARVVGWSRQTVTKIIN